MITMVYNEPSFFCDVPNFCIHVETPTEAWFLVFTYDEIIWC